MIGLHLIDDPRHTYKPTITLWFHRLFVCLSTLAHPSLTEWIPSTFGRCWCGFGTTAGRQSQCSELQIIYTPLGRLYSEFQLRRYTSPDHLYVRGFPCSYRKDTKDSIFWNIAPCWDIFDLQSQAGLIVSALCRRGTIEGHNMAAWIDSQQLFRKRSNLPNQKINSSRSP